MLTPAVFLVFSISTSHGGMTRVVLARARCYADAGVPVKLLLVDHILHEDAEEAAIRQAWGLPESVEFRYFWREAPPAGGGAPTTGDQPDGPTHLAEHDNDGRLTSARYFDPHGRLVRIDDFDPETKSRTLCRWFDRAGACWLTCWVGDRDMQKQTVQHGAEPVAFDDFNECVARWIDAVLADCQRVVVFSDKRDLDPAVMALRHPGARKVAALHSAHQQPPYRTGDPTKVNWLPLLEHLSDVDEVVALTHKQAGDITTRYGGNITVIPNSIHTPKPVEATRQPGLLVTVGRVVGEKRLQHAIRAFATVAEKVPEARYDIYGIGPKRHQLETLVTELGLDDQVQFRGHTDRPLEVFAAATATVLSSRYEGWGMALTEAMSVGTPGVAYDINYGPSDIIRHDIDGLLVSPGDIDGLADAMLRLLGDSDYAAKLGHRAREVTDRFPHQQWRNDWLALFNRLGAASRTDPVAQ